MAEPHFLHCAFISFIIIPHSHGGYFVAAAPTPPDIYTFLIFSPRFFILLLWGRAYNYTQDGRETSQPVAALSPGRFIFVAADHEVI
jgi:hypothetical protein